jgi:F-type H+-transporting ATPase subunit a
LIALALPAQDSGEFTPPGIEEMHLPAILPWWAADEFSKQMLLVIL